MGMTRKTATVLGALVLAGAVPVLPADAASKPTLSGADVTVAEAVKGGRAVVVLRLDRKPRRAVTVSWRTVDGSATQGEDYAHRTGKLRFEPGQRRATLRVPVRDDDAEEGPETFFVRLSSDRARVPDRDVKVVIGDDDAFSVELASKRRASQVFDEPVSAEDPTLLGATLEATGPDGTVYTLDVPDGALADETTVTMTPWRSASGTGIEGGRLVGVRLTPSGTRFLLPVTLRIDPPGADEVPVVTATREDAVGHGYPASLDTDHVELSLGHFSDYYGGIGEGTSMEVVDAGLLNPEQALADAMESTLRAERNRLLQGEEPDPAVMEQVVQMMTAYYDTVVAPQLGGIRTDCSQAEAHTGHVVGFARQAALLGILEPQQQEILGAVAAGASNCLEESLEPCVDPDDAAQVKRILIYWRQALLLGGTVPDPPPLDPVRHCQDRLVGTITLAVDSTFAANGFRTTEQWTLVYQPRLTTTNHGSSWYDDGQGGWTVSGSYLREDLRPGAQCQTMIEKTYSGSGTLFTSWHPQLNPTTDEGKGIFELNRFLPEFDGNLGMEPGLNGEVAGHSSETYYDPTVDGCEARNREVGQWFHPYWGPNLNEGPGAVVEDEQAGRGVSLNYTFTSDQSDADTTDLYTLEMSGTLTQKRA